MNARSPETIVVGAGIVGLTVAERLTRAGQKVSVIDARQNPFGSYEWQKLGTTYSSKDARHVSTTEHVSKARPLVVDNFNKPTSDGGFLPKPLKEFNDNEQDWINAVTWVAPDIGLVNYFDYMTTTANFIGLKLWRQRMQEDPQLFENIGLQEGVPIFYADEKELEVAVKFEGIWDPVQRLELADVKERYPRIAPHFESGLLVGGFQVDSFAMGIHRMSGNMITRLQEQGVPFAWNTPIGRIVKDINGEVRGLETKGGILLKADNYVFCPGVFGREVLKGTKADQDVMGVAGVWVDMPGVDGLEGAFKLSIAHLNVTPYEGGTYASGGFIFLGEETDIDLSAPGTRKGLENFQAVVEQIFPNQPQVNIQACLRPMSRLGDEVFAYLPAQGGGKMIISTGHGAGGTTQAPYVAEKVLHNLTGQSMSAIDGIKKPDVFAVHKAFPHQPEPLEKFLSPGTFTTWVASELEAGDVIL